MFLSPHEKHRVQRVERICCFDFFFVIVAVDPSCKKLPLVVEARHTNEGGELVLIVSCFVLVSRRRLPMGAPARVVALFAAVTATLILPFVALSQDVTAADAYRVLTDTDLRLLLRERGYEVDGTQPRESLLALAMKTEEAHLEQQKARAASQGHVLAAKLCVG